eukprot:6951071-Prymnesium_polylepis.1
MMPSFEFINSNAFAPCAEMFLPWDYSPHRVVTARRRGSGVPSKWPQRPLAGWPLCMQGAGVH